MIAYDEFIDIIAHYKQRHPETKVFCIMHWNLDMEILPLPFHRILCRKLIDAGVETVIGSHSHVPQSVEIYKDHLIAYGLGNFYIPSGIYFEGKLRYPECSKNTIGINIKNGEIYILHFKTDEETAIIYDNSNNLTLGGGLTSI